MVTVAAIGTLAAQAPGRVAAAIGNRFTARARPAADALG